MRDLIILSVIIVYWFLLGFSLTYVYQDPLIIQSLIEGNSSYVINVDTDDLQHNVTNIGYDFSDTGETKTQGFVSMIGRMFTFRIPEVEQFPAGVLTFIEFVNFILLLLVGLISYRLIRHGGG